MRFQFRVSQKSIIDATKVISLKTDAVFNMQRTFLEDRYKRIEELTRSTTMVATGETRSRVFGSARFHSSTHMLFTCGYLPTLNNQSVAQEFDLGPVHRSKKEHFRKDGTPKCSINPTDIYSMMGQQYFSNRSARRRALAKSIETTFGTRVRFATNMGHTLMYQPDLSGIIRKLSIITRAVTR